ncbi:MAG: TrmH family RNA methyltransferase, partial [Flavobacteriales bacterium]
MKENDLLIGFHPLMEAIKSGKEIQKVFIQKGLTADRMPDLKQELNKHEIPMFIVPREKLERISRKNHQGIIAFTSPIEFQNLENLLFSLFEEGKNPSFLMLDGITDVRNFGAIVRSAECMGVHAVIIPVKGMAPINADAVKSSSGALLRVPICRSTHLDKTLSFLRNSGIKVVGCTEKST